jgi:hypothetical protein
MKGWAEKSAMERRNALRLQVCRPATLTLLSEHPVQIEVMVEDLSGAGARIRTSTPLAAGTVVQLAIADALYLGEVMYCSQSGTEMHAGLALRHSLTHIQELANLMQRLMPAGPVVPLPAA